MDIVEEILELQTDEVETDDVLANLFNFMPDLVIISTPHLMRDPPLALQRRLKVCVLVHPTPADAVENQLPFHAKVGKGRRATSLRKLRTGRP